MDNLPDGFAETIEYGIIAYVVPLNVYQQGYHVKPGTPLLFISLASQKNYIAIYHMGLYSGKKLLDWFNSEYKNYSKSKPDMGKSCIRFKNPEQIPFDLIGELMRKMRAAEWIEKYEVSKKKTG